MSNDFPEGGFIPPHKQRKKPDCIREPVIPDPCILRNPKNQNFFNTNPPCLNDEIEVVCPADVVITKQHDRVVQVELDPIIPGDPLPEVPLPPPTDRFPNREIIVSCPSNAQEAAALAKYLEPCGIDYPDPDGIFPNIGNSITVQSGTYSADTQEEADALAEEEIARVVCESLNCLWGNDPMTLKCIDFLTEADKVFLASKGLSAEDLVRGEDINIPANLFTSTFSKADANRQALEYGESIVQDLCFYCNEEKIKECPEEAQPSEGFKVELCSMQNTFGLSSLTELDAKAIEYLSSLVCVDIPFFNDEFCDDLFASIKIDNPNTENDCGNDDAAYEKGQESGEVANDGRLCGFEAIIKLPKIPCPCGYDFQVKLTNPNTTSECGNDDAKYTPGTQTNDITSEPDDENPCLQKIAIELPRIPCPCGYDFQVNLTNPNTGSECGNDDAKFKPGTQTSDITSKPDKNNPCLQKIAIELPRIPCPCGYDFQVNLTNPNTAAPCGAGDKAFSPGTESGSITSEPDPNNPCLQRLDIELPRVPCPCGYNFRINLTNPNTDDACGDGSASFSPGRESGFIEPENPDTCEVVIPLELPKIPCPCGYKILFYIRTCLIEADGTFRYTTTRYGDGVLNDPCTINLGVATIPCIPFEDICIPIPIIGTGIKVINEADVEPGGGDGSNDAAEINLEAEECNNDNRIEFSIVGPGEIRIPCVPEITAEFKTEIRDTKGTKFGDIELGSQPKPGSPLCEEFFVADSIIEIPCVPEFETTTKAVIKKESGETLGEIKIGNQGGGGNDCPTIGIDPIEIVIPCIPEFETTTKAVIKKESGETLGEIKIGNQGGGGNDCPTIGIDPIEIVIPCIPEIDTANNEVEFEDENGNNKGKITLGQTSGNDCKFSLAGGPIIMPPCVNAQGTAANGAKLQDSNGNELGTLYLDERAGGNCTEFFVAGGPITIPTGCPTVSNDKVKFVSNSNDLGEIALSVNSTANDCEISITGGDINIPCYDVDGTAAVGVDFEDSNGNLLGTAYLDSDASGSGGCTKFKIAGGPIVIPTGCPTVTNDTAKITSNGNDLGEIGLSVNSTANDCEISITSTNIDIPCYEVDGTAAVGVDFEDSNGNLLGTAYLDSDASGSGGCTKFKIAGGPITIPTGCPAATNDKVKITSNGNDLGDISVAVDTSSNDCKVKISGADIDIPCYTVSGTAASGSVELQDSNGNTLGQVWLTESTGGSCTEFELDSGGPIVIPTGCPAATNDKVKITSNGNDLGDISVAVDTSSNDCKVKISGADIDIPCYTVSGTAASGSVEFQKADGTVLGQVWLTESSGGSCTEFELDSGGPIVIPTGDCPQVTNDTVKITLGGNDVGEIGLSVNSSNNDCKISIDGADIDLDACDIVSKAFVTSGTISITDPTGTAGTINPDFDDATCTLQIDANGGGTIDVLSGYSEQSITVCTSGGGTQTLTILAK
jgi:hypothetical protein